ncbi:putative protein kinase domain-containing protein, cytoplasmic-like isoform X1 [Penaeus vannamei]|uniref:Uncharacterized protein n=1 Tax=Penaeus vannamei TaxID=6689 RepID=A0A423U4Q3_PENVA|nr:putative protein kinase domain-containing protein, cytoplasmic-like isoform X1 [Penaeus vannamei]
MKIIPGPPAVGVVAVITELGHPVDMIEILQMDFESRLKLAYDVVSILQHLVHSPLGSLLMKDFRRQQFVIVGDTLKLSDVDDIVLGDPKCTHDKDCILEISSGKHVKSYLPCSAGKCKGYNSLSNAIQAGQHFMRLLIPYGSPKALENTSSDILNRLLAGNLYSEEVYSEIHRRQLLGVVFSQYPHQQKVPGSALKSQSVRHLSSLIRGLGQAVRLQSLSHHLGISKKIRSIHFISVEGRADE